MIDLLALIHQGEISIEEAERIFDETIQKIHAREEQPDWRITLNLSNYEATAYLHGATLEDLVKLRYEGWPNICARCHLPLDYTQYGWRFIHDDDGVIHLEHLECPTEPGQ